MEAQTPIANPTGRKQAEHRRKMKTCPSCRRRFIPSFNARCPKCGHNLTPGTAFDRWTAGDGDEDAKKLAWDAGRAPLLAALREIHEIATRHKRASDLKRFLLADLESIERRSSPNRGN